MGQPEYDWADFDELEPDYEAELESGFYFDDEEWPEDDEDESEEILGGRLEMGLEF